MRERNESGRYVETVGPTDVLATFDAVDGPVITSTDVAEQLDCTTEAARQKLRALVEEGTLARRSTGRTAVYWVVDDEPREARETQPTPDVVDNDASEPVDELPADIESGLREFLGDRAPRSSHGKEIVVDVLKELRRNGPMKTADLQEAVYDGYEEHYGDPRNLWNSIGRYLDDIPGFTKPGYGEWGYAGDSETRHQLEDE